MPWEKRMTDIDAWQNAMRDAFVLFWKRLTDDQRRRIYFQEWAKRDGKMLMDYDITPDEIAGRFAIESSGTQDFDEWYQFGKRMEARGMMPS